MPTFHGFGTDSLTLHAITNRLPELLRSLGDASSPETAVVFFQPSFGHKGMSKKVTDLGRVDFGHFDAIVGTQKAVYLIDSLTERSPEVRNTLVEYDRIRQYPHVIFRGYRDAWQEQKPESWMSFEAHQAEPFRVKFPRNKVAPFGSEIASALEFVLTSLQDCGNELVDVVLYHRREDTMQQPHEMIPNRFRLTISLYSTINATCIVPL